MARLPPEERPTARELAAQSNGENTVIVRGQPAAICPYCKGGMLTAKTIRLKTRVERYERCRICNKSFKAVYPPDPEGTLAYEVGDDDDSEPEREISKSGSVGLTLVRKTG